MLLVPASVYAWRKLSVRVKTGTIRRDISLTHPTNHIGGRVVSLTHTNVEYFWSSRAALSADAMPCHATHASTASSASTDCLTGSAFGTRQCSAVRMRGASYLCVSKLGPSVGTFRSHTQRTTSEVELFRSLTPMSSTFGRVVLLSQRMPCHAMLALALTGSAFGTSQCVCVAQAVCACPKLGPSVGTFRSHTQRTTSEVELFRSLTPMSSTFGRVVLLSGCHAMHRHAHCELATLDYHWQCCLVPASVYAWRKLSVRVQTGTIRRDISLTHPTNHIGGRVVSLTHTNVEYFWSSRAAVSGCHAML